MQTSQITLTDTHCHLYAAEFDPDRSMMIKRAVQNGVTKMMLPNIDEESIGPMWNLVAQFPDHCFPMMGLHPCSVRENYQNVLDRMREEFTIRPYAGVGETGVDLYWDTTFRREQIDAFEQQISWAKELGLPIIIHSRDSLDLNIDIISEHQDGRLRGIFHCFSGNHQQAEKIDRLGFKIGIGGVVTFKKAGLAEMVPGLPIHMIVLETDAPYLAPVPHRGKRNESAYLTLIANKVADMLQIPLEDLARITTENAEAVYGKKD